MNTRSLRAYVSTGKIERTLGGAAAQVLSRLSVGQARIVAIMAGGAIGTLARAGLAEVLPHRAGQWPWATFVVNLAGAFILGWLLTRLAERSAPSRHWRFFAGTGFCGALTTFSTFQLELLQMLDHDRAGLVLGYAAVSLALGVGAAELGRRAA
jgi:fluoride exporter